MIVRKALSRITLAVPACVLMLIQAGKVYYVPVSLCDLETPSLVSGFVDPATMEENFSRPPYYKVKDELKEETWWGNSESAYVRATVVERAEWAPQRRLCRETCCVESVAIF